MDVRTFASRTSALLCAFVVASSSFAGTGGKPHKHYPNELEGFRFYAEYLAPLEPGSSGEKAVRRVLGDTAAVRRNGWTIGTTYTMKSGPVYTLYQITVRPDGIIPMGAVTFSSAFTHCHSVISEINIRFDVYGDRFGLEYWLHGEDSKWGKKGDLYHIVYGERRRPDPPNTICG